MDSSQKQADSNSSNKVSLETISKENLVKKYKALLNIAHKAKAAKDEYAEETKNLKIELQNFESQKEADKRSIVTMKEVVEALTESKLSLTNEIQQLQKKNGQLELEVAKFDELRKDIEVRSIENESLKRQVDSMTAENETLLQDLEKMEARFKQVTEVGMDQRKQLVLLEKATEKMLQNEPVACEKCPNLEAIVTKQAARITRFEDRLSNVITKLRKLKECKKILLETQHDYADSISKWQKDIVNASNLMWKNFQSLEETNKNLMSQQGQTPSGLIEISKIERHLYSLIHICDRSIIEHQKENEALKTSLSEKQIKIDELQKLLDNASTSLIQNGTVADLESKINLNSDKLIVIESNLNEKEILISDKEQQLADMKNQILSTQSEVEQLSEKAISQDNLNETKKERDSLKSELSKIKKELKKSKTSNVLYLEIEAYEKSLNETTKNLNSKLEEVGSLKSLLETNSLENESLRKDIETLKQRVVEVETEANAAKKLIKVEENCIKLQSENEKLLQQVVMLEHNVETLTDKLSLAERSLQDVQLEYSNYKLKAKSVLRQQPNKEPSRENELEEELSALQAQKDTLNFKLKNSTSELVIKNSEIEEIRMLNDRLSCRIKDLTNTVSEAKQQNETLFKQNRTINEEYQETLRHQRTQIDALNARSKQQIEELTSKHLQELDEARRTINNGHSDLPLRIDPIGGFNSSEHISSMERENAEGSESSIPQNFRRKTSSTRSKYDLLPLGELLNNSFDETCEVDSAPNRLNYESLLERSEIHETRVRHLSSLLAETEQDLAKASQMNEVLKEELRRQERGVEREKHMHNSEYIKNVFLKFVTLNNGDERVRMIPVLNTILKLSPDETNMLQNAANGKANQSHNRGWGSYLPAWSNGN